MLAAFAPVHESTWRLTTSTTTWTGEPAPNLPHRCEVPTAISTPS